jgi:glycosyltransferase involved in cell wall biosynthesis
MPPFALKPTPSLADVPAASSGTNAWPWRPAPRALPDTMPNGRAWPRFTIVTPSYGQGVFIEEAIRSVLRQGYPNVEYVVVDGGSTDSTCEVIRKYEAWLADWRSEPDRGPAHGLNKGFERASGDIYGYLNADDVYLPGCFEAVALAMSAMPAADVIYGDGYLAGASYRPMTRHVSDRWSLRGLAYGTCILVQPATFVRRRAWERIAGFNEANRTCWDAELLADLAIAGASFHRISRALAASRIHPGSITGSGRPKREGGPDLQRIFAKVMGRRPLARDRIVRAVGRLVKFSRHPHRTALYRLTFWRTLGRLEP